MNLVIGATGVLGSEICRRLRARGLPVRALVRRGSAREAELKALGVEIAHGDLRKPGTLDVACERVTTVFSTATAMGSKDRSLTLKTVDRDGQLYAVAAAKAAGVKRFVFISVSPTLKPPAPLIRYKREVETAVRASGMRWTILQPSVFMEIWLGPLLGWDHAAGRATIFGDGRGVLNWVSVADVAELAVRALDDPRLENKDIPVGGPEALAPNEVLRIFEDESGRSYSAKRIPRAMLVTLGPVVSVFNEAVGSGMSLGAQGALGEQLDTSLMKSLGMPLTTVREYAKRVSTRS
jgi:NADH dehydrogenase